jgi:nucleoside-diphosphate-sugar epimerase
MSQFTIVGSGSTGTTVAHRLSASGHSVTMVTRHGTGPQCDGIELVAADATNADRLTEITAGSRALFNCANPPYHRWPTDWPPLAASLLRTAERTGATLVTLSNLYAYGVPTAPMTPHDPLNARYLKAQIRAQMWRDALASHLEGRVRAVEVRASDFIGPGANSVVGDRVIPRILEGKSCSVIGDPSALHSWTFVDDVAATLVACALGSPKGGFAPRGSREPHDARVAQDRLPVRSAVCH